MPSINITKKSKLNKLLNKTSNSLLKSKKTKDTKDTKSKDTKSKNTKDTKKPNTNKKNNKKKHSIDKFCKFYKNDVNGKINKNLYTSCKINKYFRKYKCQNIDTKLFHAKTKTLGQNHNKIIFDAIKSSCPQNHQNMSEEDETKIIKKQKQCEKKAIKKIYKDNNLDNLYKKSVECDNIICAKEQKIFNINLFRQKQINLRKSLKRHIDEKDFVNEVDLELIERGD